MDSVSRLLATAAAGTMIAAFAIPALAAEGDAKKIWDHHLQSAMAHDLDAAMTDFTDESAIVTAGATFKGKEAIRGFLGEAVKGFTPEAVKSIKVNVETVAGDVVFFNYTVGAAKRTFSDTVVIEGGKIRAITVVNYPAE